LKYYSALVITNKYCAAGCRLFNYKTIAKFKTIPWNNIVNYVFYKSLYYTRDITLTDTISHFPREHYNSITFISFRIILKQVKHEINNGIARREFVSSVDVSNLYFPDTLHIHHLKLINYIVLSRKIKLLLYYITGP